MKMNYEGIQNASVWEAAGVKLPKHNWQAMCGETVENPSRTWPPS